jgi:hypothetical protein
MRQILGAWSAGLLIAAAPAFSYAQAVGISRPQTLPDRSFVEKHCTTLEQHPPIETLATALQRAREACAAYAASSKDRRARDAWVRAMLAIQDDVGPGAMRKFVPEFGGALPDGLESYSLFLFPDSRWLERPLADELPTLWQAFFEFGRSIGDDHAAIWFLDDEDNADVLRSQEYCQRFGLNYNDGPYVVVVHKRPDLLEADDEIVVIRMGGIAPERVLSILNRLSRDLRTSGRIGTGALVYEELKQRLVTQITKYPEGARAFVTALIGL